MIYLASPYIHRDPEVVEFRYTAALDATATLIQRGLFVYSPIVHCHPMAMAHKMPTDANWWLHYNLDFLRRSDELYILCIPGWSESHGVALERNFWQQLGREPIFLAEDD